MARKSGECPPEGAPLWVVTYGDMMSLLLTFFILLFSFSSIERIKFEAAISSIQEGLGIMPESQGVMEQIKLENQTARAKETEDFVSELSQTLKELDLQKSVEVYNTPEGVSLIISDPLLFASGQATIEPKFRILVGKIGKLLKSMTFSEIRVEGHTDNIPIQTAEFPSNWDLSAARALTVTKYMAFEGGLSPEKLSAVGYGEYRPRATNDTPEGRARNRRVEVHIIYKQEGQY